VNENIKHEKEKEKKRTKEVIYVQEGGQWWSAEHGGLKAHASLLIPNPSLRTYGMPLAGYHPSYLDSSSDFCFGM